MAGADVWKGQWLVSVLDGGSFESAFVAPTIEAALEHLGDAAAIGVDVPIGLPAPGRPREADLLARAYIGPRWPSVFITPSTDLIEADTLALANELARADSRPGVSAQAYALRKHIRQVGPVAARDERVHEVHPEVSLVRANAGSHLPWPKTSWNGVNLRRRILRSQGIVLPDELPALGPAGFADVLDAAVVAWSAAGSPAGGPRPFPPGPPASERSGASRRPCHGPPVVSPTDTAGGRGRHGRSRGATRTICRRR